MTFPDVIIKYIQPRSQILSIYCGKYWKIRTLSNISKINIDLCMYWRWDYENLKLLV